MTRGAARLAGALALVTVIAAPLRAQGPRIGAGRVGPSFTGMPATPPATAPDPRPSLEPLRVGGEVVVGAYTGLAGYFLGRYAGSVVGDYFASASDDTKDRIASGFGLAGGWLGTVGGAYAIGSIGNQTGSFVATILGSGIGAVGVLAFDRFVLAPRRSDPSQAASEFRWSTAMLECFVPSIGATIGFNSSRRFK